MRRVIICMISLCVFAQPIFAENITPTEQRIADYIVKQQPAQIALLKKLVNINSGTENVKGVHRVGEMVRPQFKQLGFTTQWFEQPKSMHRAGTLIAEHQGTKGKRLLLIAHLDTVFPPQSDFQRFAINGNLATGPGVVDDKGGIVVILYALKALQAADVLKDTTITVVLTGDEEESGKPTSISRKPLIDIANNSDIALDFELGTLDTLTIARRGISNWFIRTEGNSSHSSEIFQNPVGYGAVFELSRILNTMRDELSNEEYLSFNPGIILGGTTIDFKKTTTTGSAFGKQNVIAKEAFASGDLRYISTEQKLDAKQKILTIVENHLPGTTASITFVDGIPSMPPTKDNLKLLKKYSAVSVTLGYGTITASDPNSRGAGDISYIANKMQANVSGLGPIGQGTHSTNETLALDALAMQTQRAALFIYRLTQE